MPRMSSLPSDLTTDRNYNGKVAQTMKETSNPTLAKYWAEWHRGLERQRETCIHFVAVSRVSLRV